MEGIQNALTLYRSFAHGMGALKSKK